MKKFYLAVFALVFALTLRESVSAETPVVTSFNAPSSLESGQIANIGWTIEGGGHSLIVFCTQGIKLLYSTTNQVFPCDTRVSISKTASDGVSLIVANVSGSGRIITARIIPKDPNGAVDYNAGAKEATIYINPARQPISGFYSTATTTLSESPTKLYWTSKYLDGVNLKIACNEFVTATSSSFGTGILPCGRTIFPTDLPGNGSINILFNNPAPFDVPLEVTLLPAMSPGVYNGINATTLNLTIASDAQRPISTSFTSTRTKIFSGDSILFSWAITNGSGANIKFSCSPFLSLQWYSAATTTPVACGNWAWKNPLSPTGSTSISFMNSNTYDEVVTATIFPFLKNKTYDGSKTETIKIVVAPVLKYGTVLQQQTVSIAPIATSSSTSTTATTSIGKNVFKRWLGFGSKGEDVKLLQKFLANDKTLYPESLTTSYFGPATKRAVGRFQLKYGIVKSSQDSGYGFVGPKTRVLLNTLQ